ncbi:heterokaryon incompatibility protein [Pyrenophora tritici-repentis]|nr:heterokaryon incompatibility protein [Pyrenophora tritici-repentis]
MTNQYNYDPIDQSTREIRLLKLLPQDGNSKFKNTPSCDIFHTSLNKNPKFIALSYVWGNAKDLGVIRVKDCTVKVTKNLYEAMMALGPRKEPLVIWIDALCINQSDDNEKSWQVGLMADIYRRVHKVVAWLGPADDDSNQVIDYLNSLGAKAEEVGFEFGPDVYKEAWSKLPSKRSAVSSKEQFMVFPRTVFDWSSMFRSVLSENIFYSISGFDRPGSLLPIAGMERLFTRPW